MTTTETPIRTSTCSHAGCPWQLDIYGPEEELVEADHAHQHAMVAPTTHYHDGTPHVGHWSTFGTYWCDTCNSPYCDLA